MQGMVVGVPGTGKTYFMVHFLKKYFTYDSFYRDYTIKADVLIITNIAGLKFYCADCWDIESPKILGKPDQGIAGKYTREEFFTIPNMEKIMEKTGKRNIILVLDEIQKHHYFPLGYKDPAVLYLFAYHRHIGMSIVLGTQDTALVARGVTAQCEYLAHGKLRSKKIVGAMSYTFTDNKGHFLYSKTLRTDKEVFAAYQSASVDEVNKPKNALLHYALIALVLLSAGVGLFKTALAMVASKSKPKGAVVGGASGGPVHIASSPQPVAPSGVVMNNNTSNRLLPVPAAGPQWRVYNVEAYIRDGGRSFYMINGVFVDSLKCREYNQRLSTVEYFSIDALPQRLAIRAGAVGVADSGGASRQKEEALAGSFSPAVQYQPLRSHKADPDTKE